MKVQIAVIKLVLRTNKVLADGSHPIMLRASFNGMKEKSTGYSCSLKFWDKKNECVKKGFPNFLVINAELKKQKDEAIAKRDKYIASDEVYTPAMILAKEETRNAATNDVKGLIERYIAEKGVSSRVVAKWWSVYRSMLRFVGKNELIVNEINEAFCRRYAKWLNENGVGDGTIRAYLSIVGALCHYSMSLGLMTKYPFEAWKYNRVFAESKNELYVHKRSMDVLIEMLLDELIVREDGGWSYKEGAVEELLKVKSKLYALYLYLVGYYMCGLAPIDITLLKKKDIKVVQLNGKMCYAIDGRRNKTGKPYRIRLIKDCLLSNVLINTMLMFNGGEYFLPTLNVYGSRSELKKRIGNIYSKFSESLMEWFQRANEEIARRNVEGDNIPLIDLHCRYYSYRHSYIMSEIQKQNVNLLRIATLTGKAVTTLHQYITLLDDLDLV